MSAAGENRRHDSLGGLDANVAETPKIRACTNCSIIIDALVEEVKRLQVEREADLHELDRHRRAAAREADQRELAWHRRRAYLRAFTDGLNARPPRPRRP